MKSKNLNHKTILLNASAPKSLINFREKLIVNLIKAGYEVHTSAPDISPDMISQIESLGASAHNVPLSRTGFSLLSDFRYLWAIYQLTKRVRAGTIVNYTIKPNIWGSIAAKLAGARSHSMITGLGYTFDKSPGLKHMLMSRVAKLLYLIAVRCNDRVIFQNPDDLNDFEEAGCLDDPRKARIVNGSGVDLDKFALAPLPETPNFIIIARLLKSKGILHYVKAAEIIKQEYPQAKFYIAGSGDTGPDSIGQDEIDKWRSSAVTYLGQLKDVRQAIADASVFVLPSWYREGTPRTVLEAMSMGRAIITTDSPGCRETVEDGKNGLSIRPQSTDSLIKAMRYLAESQTERARMGKNAREIATKKYDAEKVSIDTLQKMNLL